MVNSIPNYGIYRKKTSFDMANYPRVYVHFYRDIKSSELQEHKNGEIQTKKSENPNKKKMFFCLFVKFSGFSKNLENPNKKER
jgi:hypothetical protein